MKQCFDSITVESSGIRTTTTYENVMPEPVRSAIKTLIAWQGRAGQGAVSAAIRAAAAVTVTLFSLGRWPTPLIYPVQCSALQCGAVPRARWTPMSRRESQRTHRVNSLPWQLTSTDIDRDTKPGVTEGRGAPSFRFEHTEIADRELYESDCRKHKHVSNL